jgi:RNA polymerase sigma-70 factor (ECF subfamily)
VAIVTDFFEDLMTRLRGGDAEVSAAVFERFQGRLVALARHRLEDRLGRMVDPEDVLQSVFASFFIRCRQGQYELENWESLWGLLTVITLRKCCTRLKYLHAECRDVQREESLDASEALRDTLKLLSHEPSPDQAAALTEMVELLMAWLEPRDREILALHLQDYNIPEIAERVDRAERTVRRVLARVRGRLTEVLGRAEEVAS